MCDRQNIPQTVGFRHIFSSFFNHSITSTAHMLITVHYPLDEAYNILRTITLLEFKFKVLFSVVFVLFHDK